MNYGVILRSLILVAALVFGVVAGEMSYPEAPVWTQVHTDVGDGQVTGLSRGLWS